MKRNEVTGNEDFLTTILNAASKEELVALLKELAENDSTILKICVDDLGENENVSSTVRNSAKSSSALAEWYSVEPELAELDEDGGGDYYAIEEVGDSLYQLIEALQEVALTEDDRIELLDEVLGYIESGNAGMDDALYDVAYAACKNDEQLNDLAERFEELEGNWPMHHARCLYRKLGNHKKYIELRLKCMQYGMDYHDLASFYWEIGEKEKAMDTAQKGMKQAVGRMTELRMFLAERAKEEGDREAYLNYYFDEKTESLTLSSYKEFEKKCQGKEWEKYEARIIALMEKRFDLQAAKIYLYRKEYEKAIRFFKAPPFRSTFFYSGRAEEFQVAESLEERYPEQILEFYKSSVGNLNLSTTRKAYAQNAKMVMRIRRVLVEVMKNPVEWRRYAVQIRSNNAKRPAFQEEFANVIPDWKSL